MNEDDILMNIKKILVEDDTGVDSLFKGDKAIDMKSLLKEEDRSIKEKKLDKIEIQVKKKEPVKVKSFEKKASNEKNNTNNIFEEELQKSRKNLELIRKKRLERKKILNSSNQTLRYKERDQKEDTKVVVDRSNSTQTFNDIQNEYVKKFIEIFGYKYTDLIANQSTEKLNNWLGSNIFRLLEDILFTKLQEK